MAKGGIPTKLKSVFKKLNSFGSRSSSSLTRQNTISPAGDYECPTARRRTDLCPVYVGKSLRQYLVGAEVIHHPLFRELVDRSGGGSGGDSDTITVSCEVVLFEHLLWMLENADESMDGQLVDFYAC